MMFTQTKEPYTPPKCEVFDAEFEAVCLVDSDEYYYQGAPDD